MLGKTRVIMLALALGACAEAAPVVVSPAIKPVESKSPVAATPPAPTDPAPVTDGDVTIASVNGVKIIVKRIPSAELAAMQLYINGGVREWTSADAGITRLSLATAIAGGTSTLGRDAFHRRLSTLGSSLDQESGIDFATIKGKALVSHWDDTFDLLVSTFLSPALPTSELELQRQKQISGIRSQKDSPDGSLSLLVHQTVYKGHPVEHRAIGTEESVARLNLDAIKTHLGKLRETSRLVFVTVGDVDPAHVVEKVRVAFGALPRGNYETKALPDLKFDKPSLSVTEQKLATNYIQGAFPVPTCASPEYPEMLVAMRLLHNRIFEEVRTKRNLSYAPGAWAGGRGSVEYGSLYVTAVNPNATIKVMFDEVRKLQTELVSEKELAGTKAVVTTNLLMSHETTDKQAEFLANANWCGDWKSSRMLPEKIRAVTPTRVQAFAKKYVGRLQMVVLGDPTKIDKDLFSSL